METIRWIIFSAALMLIIMMCKLNVHQHYFNFFMLGLFLMSYVVIVLIWCTCRWEGLEHAESMTEKK